MPSFWKQPFTEWSVRNFLVEAELSGNEIGEMAGLTTVEVLQ